LAKRELLAWFGRVQSETVIRPVGAVRLLTTALSEEGMQPTRADARG
jgi:hypothetical protein